MIETILSIIELIQFELLLFCAIWFLIAGFDDILVDLIWMGRWCYRRLTIYRYKKPMSADEFISSAHYSAEHTHDKIDNSNNANANNFHAIFVPAWQEANVIGEMLQGCKRAWMNANVAHRIYVGCYPNDNATIAQVIIAAKSNPAICIILCSNDGPTTKADCLNHLWRALLRDELNHGVKAKSVILHDAEDRPHAQSLAIFDRLIGKNDIVQLPVIPISVPGSPLISGHYCDEFCESHGKAMVVREALGAALPLAGVGCAIDRNCLGRYALGRNNLPFDSDSVTEDYELGLHIGNMGRGAIMVRMHDGDGQLIGTCSFFPTTIGDAVKQKSRWTLGIALSGWDRVGWARMSGLRDRKFGFSSDARVQGEAAVKIERRKNPNKHRGLQLPFNISENWMRFRDRRAIFSALTLFCAYIMAALTLLLMVAQYAGLYILSPLNPMMQTLIFISSCMLMWRFIMRTAFLYYHYGFAQACLALPRMIISNVIAIMAARRAVMLYVRHCFGGKIHWDKTQHISIPSDQIYAQSARSSHDAGKGAIS